VWYIKARNRLKELGFTAFPDDESCFIHQHMQLVISLYVDDIQYMSAILDEILKVKSQLADIFHITNSGNTNYYLGMDIHYN
jgi:hypothetical protein